MGVRRKDTADQDGSAHLKAERRPIRLVPSGVWVNGIRALWAELKFRERGIIILGIFLPILDHVSRLGSLGITMKAVSRAVRHPLDIDARLWLSLVIFCAFGAAALIQISSSRARRGLKLQLTKIVRKAHGRMMATAVNLPLEDRDAHVNGLLKGEKDFVNSATSGLLALVEFLTSFQVVALLLAVLIWFSPAVGAILMVCGLSALLILRRRIRNPAVKETDKIGDAREAMLADFEAISKNSGERTVLIEQYVNNQFDKLVSEEARLKSQTQSRISTTMNVIAAILMALVFFLISAKGAIDEQKVVWIVIFVLGLRMVVSQGKVAMVKWGATLAEKKSIMLLARAALAPQLFREEDVIEIAAEPLDDGDGGDSLDIPVRIVDFSFSGLDGSEVVSREPLAVEMTVESDEDIEGFFWSFAITLQPGPPYLMLKSSEDCGVKWSLPKGRSTFKMVTGPIWLPAGEYFGMVGRAEGGRLLALAGGADSPISLQVLPDEIAKRSPQTRVAHDVVLIDVEWKLEFDHEILEAERLPQSSPVGI
jgi:hypothetical protein